MTSWMKKLVFVGALSGSLALVGCDERTGRVGEDANQQRDVSGEGRGVGGAGSEEGSFSGRGDDQTREDKGSGLQSVNPDTINGPVQDGPIDPTKGGEGGSGNESGDKAQGERR